MSFNTTLSYDPSDDPDAQSLADERDAESYAIGEQLEAEQNQLLAGKFTDAKALEDAYLELQRAYHSRGKSSDDNADDNEGGDDATQANDEEQEEEDYESSAAFGKALLDEYVENGGVLSQETADYLQSLDPAEAVEAVLALQNELQQGPVPLSEEDQQAFHQIVGGTEEYRSMVEWAADNLPEGMLDAYNSVMDSGSPEAIYFAVQALSAQYLSNAGYDGNMVEGPSRPTDSRGDVFRSQAELIRAMEDPRYDRDIAYRQDVERKLERSNIEF